MDDSGHTDPQTYAIIGAAMKVHNTLGKGFLEKVYQEAFAVELQVQRIPFDREVLLPIYYRGQRLNTAYRVDFICFDEVLVEIKAVRQLSENDEAQVLNYLKASNHHRAILLNFGASSLQHRRRVHGHVPN